jgi:hypothetical protein
MPDIAVNGKYSRAIDNTSLPSIARTPYIHESRNARNYASIVESAGIGNIANKHDRRSFFYQVVVTS